MIGIIHFFSIKILTWLEAIVAKEKKLITKLRETKKKTKKQNNKKPHNKSIQQGSGWGLWIKKKELDDAVEVVLA